MYEASLVWASDGDSVCVHVYDSDGLLVGVGVGGSLGEAVDQALDA